MIRPTPGEGIFPAPLGRWDVGDAVPYVNPEPIT
jgi:hypothetical protein